MSTKVAFSYKTIAGQAVIESLKKLHPRDEIKNLVMFVVWLGSIFTTIFLFLPGQFNSFNIQICIWLWFTCLFAKFRGGDGGGTRKGPCRRTEQDADKDLGESNVGGNVTRSRARRLR